MVSVASVQQSLSRYTPALSSGTGSIMRSRCPPSGCPSPLCHSSHDFAHDEVLQPSCRLQPMGKDTLYGPRVGAPIHESFRGRILPVAQSSKPTRLRNPRQVEARYLTRVPQHRLLRPQSATSAECCPLRERRPLSLTTSSRSLFLATMLLVASLPCKLALTPRPAGAIKRLSGAALLQASFQTPARSAGREVPLHPIPLHPRR